MRAIIFAALAAVPFWFCNCSPSYGVTMTFDDIVVGTEFAVGEIIESGGGTILVGGSPTTRTITSVLATTTAGGTGNEVHNYADRELIFQLPHSMSMVTFKYMNSGGTNVINVNGFSSPTVGSFGQLDGMSIGDVDFSVLGSNPGTLILTGAISSLVVAGQEMKIDDVTLVPEPSSIMLVIAATLLAIDKQRRH